MSASLRPSSRDPQIFRHSTHYLARATIVGAIFILLAALWVTADINVRLDTGHCIERQQPVQFLTNITWADAWIAVTPSAFERGYCGMPSTTLRRPQADRADARI